MLRLSEIFESIQGEGPSAGAPAVFLRLATCNLRCSFCDTKYTWDWNQYRYDVEVRHVDVAAVAQDLAQKAPRRLVITGGEPLLQQRALRTLLASFGEEWFVELETNGTLSPSPALVERVNQWNVSPKLANSAEPEERRLSFEALSCLRGTGRAWLKWVIASEHDAEEAARLTARLEWPRSRVLFMPLASSRDELSLHSPAVERSATRHGFATSPRLHIERWDGKRGV